MRRTLPNFEIAAKYKEVLPADEKTKTPEKDTGRKGLVVRMDDRFNIQIETKKGEPELGGIRGFKGDSIIRRDDGGFDVIKGDDFMKNWRPA
jgi:hypothetical protein